ncbi:MAG: hypothetical protein WBC40_07005 [Halobacteriota archaeon]
MKTSIVEKQKNCGKCAFRDDAMTVIDTCVLSSLAKKRDFYEFSEDDRMELFSYFE